MPGDPQSLDILLVGNYRRDRQYSMLRFADILAAQLSAAHRVRLVFPPEILGRLPARSASLRKWLAYIDKFLIFPWLLRLQAVRADVVHICDHSNAMYVRAVSRRAHVVTCHDLLAIRSAQGEFAVNRVGGMGRLLQNLILGGLRRAQRIVCDAPSTIDDLRQLGGFDAAELSVVGLYCTLEPMTEASAWPAIAPLGIPVGTRFFLHVGTDAWYKNRQAVAEIFARLKAQGFADHRLVMVGPQPQAMREGISPDVIADILWLSDLDDSAICALYSTAQALIFPSLAEGFGWPVLEAQACGCPVFASNRAPMTWVGGDAAHYFDPQDPDGAAALIGTHVGDLDAMRAAGLVNAARFTPQAMVQGYEQQYRAAIADRAKRSEN